MPGARLLELDDTGLAESIGERACSVRHALVDHPLLSWEAIAALSEALPANAVERHAASQPLLVPGARPRFGGRPSETVLDLEHSAWSLVLRNIERSPAYRQLLDASLDELEDRLPAEHGRLREREASLVLAAPLAVTPARVEVEHHLLLQVHADKQVNVGRFGSAEAERRAHDRLRVGAQRNLEQIPHDTVAFELGPGDGVYLPPVAPHWMRNGPFASISLALAFRTPPASPARFETRWPGVRPV